MSIHQQYDIQAADNVKILWDHHDLGLKVMIERNAAETYGLLRCFLDKNKQRFVFIQPESLP